MEMNEYEEGVPSWVDVACPDVAAGRAFYSALFGWEIVEAAPEAGGYSIAHKNGRSVAGVGPQMNPMAPPAWTNYVSVSSADGTAEKITANGGSMFMAPIDVMDAGRMAIFADPMGAVLGIWQAGRNPGAGIVNELHTWCWSELVTTDVERSKQFYAAVFGWGADTHGGGPNGDYTEWKVNDRSIGGMMSKPPNMPAEAPPFWSVYFTVDDVGATAKQVAQLGGSVVTGPMDVEPGQIQIFTDPGGAAFGVIRFHEMPD